MILRVVLVLAALGAAWAVLVALLFAWPRADEPPARADAVVVLAGGLNKRLDPAIALMKQGVAPVLAISSAFHDEKWKKARRLCRGQLGPTRYSVLCFEAKPYSTRGEARTVARLARTQGWKRVVVVTSRYHVTRARVLFERCYPGKLWVVGTGSTWWRLPQHWFDETGKLLVQETVQRGC